MSYEARILDRYRKAYSIHLGTTRIKEGILTSGVLRVTIQNNPSLAVEGSFNANNGLLSGLAKLFKTGCFPDDVVRYEVVSPTSIMILVATGALQPAQAEEPSEELICVWEEKNLKNKHFEVFRPDNHQNWEPSLETDVYMLFGALQAYTGYKYCCATDQPTLRDLGYDCTETTTPDAILIDEATGLYVISEFKMRSSSYKSNHEPKDVDVLVCWEDDETNRGRLPLNIVELKEAAKLFAKDSSEDG